MAEAANPLLDQQFADSGIGAKLLVTQGPFNPFTESVTLKDGKTINPRSLDSAWLTARPGVEFLRPWIAVRNGPAFQWPLGMQGFSTSIEPALGIHKFVGDNGVTIDVQHAGEEHFTLTGDFPGDTAPAMMKALRAVVYYNAGSYGKVLYLPEIMHFAERVQIANAQFNRADDARGRDMTYSIEFVRIADTAIVTDDVIAVDPVPPAADTSKGARHMAVDAKHNTLRKIAAYKLKDAKRWREVYNKNKKWFVNHNVSLSAAPDYRLPIGLAIYY